MSDPIYSMSRWLIFFCRGNGKLCHPQYDFRGIESELFFEDVSNRENQNPRKVILTFLNKTAKIWRRENNPFYGIER